MHWSATLSMQDVLRFGFNGKENDNEVKGNGSQQDYGMRIYDPRLGKFLSVDPLTKSYPMLTPYQFASNSPISGVDLDGLEFYYAANGSLLGKIGTSTEVRVVNNKDAKDVAFAVFVVNMNGASKEGIEYFTAKSNRLSTDLGVNNDQLVAFGAVIDAESSGAKAESYAIANATMNFLDEGGSTQLKTLEDVTMYDNSFAQGATQEGYSAFKGKSASEQNSKFALGAAINAIGFSKGLKSFTDESGGADSWDGKDLVSTKFDNSHRGYSWSSGSKDLLVAYKKDVNGGVDVTKFTYKKTGFQIEATKAIGKTIFTNHKGGRGEKKQSAEKFK